LRDADGLRVDVAWSDDGVCMARVDDEMDNPGVDPVEDTFMQGRLSEGAVQEGESRFGVLGA